MDASRVTADEPAPERYDVAVIGGGPAGLSAAVAAGRMNRRTICFETATPRTAHAPRYFNYLGFPDGISGRDLLRRGRQQAERWGARLEEAEVTAVERLDDGGPSRFRVRAGDALFDVDGIVLATGIQDRQPTCGNLYGETGVHYCVVCDGYETRGQRVAVLGCGPRAFSMLRALRDFTADLHLLLDGTAADEVGLAEDLEQLGATVVPDRLERYECTPEGVRFRTAAGGDLTYPHVFVALGVSANTALAASLGCARDAEGYVVTDACQATSVPFVFAAGDCDGGHKQVTQAMAEGEMAALELARALRRAGGPAAPAPSAPRPAVATPSNGGAARAS